MGDAPFHLPYPHNPRLMTRLTVLIPTSPIPTHPSTSIIEETIESVRFLVEAETLIMVDGIRPEQEELTGQYQEYVQRLIWLCNWEWDAQPILYPWLHQAGVTKATLPLVETSTFLFVEHDTPLLPDIPFRRLIPLVESGVVNVIRFYHEAQIHSEHQHLMIGNALIEEIPLTFTRQYSQRPMLINTDWYRKTMAKFFTDQSRCFIEDRLHSPAQNEPWGLWRLAIYTPEGVIKRSTHTDGRAGGPKFDESQIW